MPEYRVSVKLHGVIVLNAADQRQANEAIYALPSMTIINDPTFYVEFYEPDGADLIVEDDDNA